MRPRLPLGPYLLRHFRKAVLICLLLSAVLAFVQNIVQPGPEPYGEDPGGTFMQFFSIDHDDKGHELLQHSSGKRQLSNVPDRRLYLPPYFSLVDLDAKVEENFNCTTTTTDPSFPICVYPTEQDIYISAALTSTGVWEPYMTKVYQVALRKYPEAVVIDVGANLGYYSLLAGKMGHKVIAVEPSQENMNRLRKGVRLSGLTDKVHLLKNALAKSHRNMTLSVNSNNQGGIHVLEDGDPQQGERTQTIVMNDLLYLLPSGVAIIKIDIEGYECRGMETSAKFFRSVQVPYIFMEWQQMYRQRHRRVTPCPAHIMQRMTDFLTGLGYVAHEVWTGIQLNPHRSTTTWQIGDVYWRQRDQPLLLNSL